MTETFHFFLVFRRVKTNALELQLLKLTNGLQAELSAKFLSMYEEWQKEDREVRAYSPTYRPSNGELTRIKPFGFPPPYHNSALVPTSYPKYSSQHNPAQLAMKAILGVRPGTSKDDSLYLFQSCNQSHMLGRKFTILLDGSTFQRLQAPGITLSDRLSAVVEGGSLIFESFLVTRGFIDLAHLYTSATDEEIKTVLRHKLFADGYDLDGTLKLCGVVMRQQFMTLIERGMLDHQKVTADRVHAQAVKFGFPLQMRGKPGERRLVVPTEKKALQQLLQLLTERVYFGPITERKYETNSYDQLPESPSTSGEPAPAQEG